MGSGGYGGGGGDGGGGGSGGGETQRDSPLNPDLILGQCRGSVAMTEVIC